MGMHEEKSHPQCNQYESKNYGAQADRNHATRHKNNSQKNNAEMKEILRPANC